MNAIYKNKTKQKKTFSKPEKLQVFVGRLLPRVKELCTVLCSDDNAYKTLLMGSFAVLLIFFIHYQNLF